MHAPVNSFDYSLLKYIILFIVLKFIKLFIIQLFQCSIINTTTNVTFSPSISTVFHPLPKILLLAGTSKFTSCYLLQHKNKWNCQKNISRYTCSLGPCTWFLHVQVGCISLLTCILHTFLI